MQGGKMFIPLFYIFWYLFNVFQIRTFLFKRAPAQHEYKISREKEKTDLNYVRINEIETLLFNG